MGEIQADFQGRTPRSHTSPKFSLVDTTMSFFYGYLHWLLFDANSQKLGLITKGLSLAGVENEGQIGKA